MHLHFVVVHPMHSALYLPKPSAQLLPPYLNPDGICACAGFAAVSEACVGCKQYWQPSGHGVKWRCWDASLLRFCRAFRHGGSCAALACPMSLSAVAYLE